MCKSVCASVCICVYLCVYLCGGGRGGLQLAPGPRPGDLVPEEMVAGVDYVFAEGAVFGLGEPVVVKRRCTL